MNNTLYIEKDSLFPYITTFDPYVANILNVIVFTDKYYEGNNYDIGTVRVVSQKRHPKFIDDMNAFGIALVYRGTMRMVDHDGTLEHFQQDEDELEIYD